MTDLYPSNKEYFLTGFITNPKINAPRENQGFFPVKFTLTLNFMVNNSKALSCSVIVEAYLTPYVEDSNKFLDFVFNGNFETSNLVVPPDFIVDTDKIDQYISKFIYSLNKPKPLTLLAQGFPLSSLFDKINKYKLVPGEGLLIAGDYKENQVPQSPSKLFETFKINSRFLN